MSERIETPWLTAEEVRAYLGGISEATLHRYRRAGLPTHYVANKSPRWHRDEVDAWVRNNNK